ncbi:MAG: phosphate ABC transporter permease subunit PstC [Ruminococcaceae bacterium]|nr:phosphate ABC transporter permease subunit PstC [Oscillospiraceae bacterium]
MQKLSEKFMKAIFFTAALVSVIAVILICLFLGINGILTIEKIGVKDFLTGTLWQPLKGLYGILPMIIGSIYVTAGAIILGVPLGLLCAVFLAYFCPKWLYRILKPATDLLAGIPSIVYGFFGLTVIVPLIQRLFGGSGKGVLAASLILGIMILPSVISISEAALRAVPKSYYEGALALGATHERGVYSVSLPAAKSGIAAGIVLGVGRAIGEAMAVSMVAGNQPIIPGSILSGVRTLTSNIVLEMGYAEGLHRDALIATGVVLFVFILIINIMFSLLTSKERNK